MKSAEQYLKELEKAAEILAALEKDQTDTNGKKRGNLAFLLMQSRRMVQDVARYIQRYGVSEG